MNEDVDGLYVGGSRVGGGGGPSVAESERRPREVERFGKGGGDLNFFLFRQLPWVLLGAVGGVSDKFKGRCIVLGLALK